MELELVVSQLVLDFHFVNKVKVFDRDITLLTARIQLSRHGLASLNLIVFDGLVCESAETVDEHEHLVRLILGQVTFVTSVKLFKLLIEELTLFPEVLAVNHLVLEV